MAIGPALLTDRYELTMLQAALADGTADRRCTFEVFARRLPEGRRYGVVAGTGRLVDLLPDVGYGDDDLAALRDGGVVDAATCRALESMRFGGDIDGYAEGEIYYPGSPVLTVTASFAEAVLLETLVLSVLNHDSAVAAAASRMAVAAGDRALIEMGSRRTHEEAAVAAARAAHLVGFGATSNLAAGARWGIPTAGTSAHAFTLVHDDEASAFAAQVAAFGSGTTLLVDTYDIDRGIRTAVEVAGTGLGAIRIDSGDLAVRAFEARATLDSLGAAETRIVVSGDLDELGVAALAAAPVDAYGIGTSLVTGSGHPTAGMVYKLVEVDGRPVAKRSSGKDSPGGRKSAVRRHRDSGTSTAEVVAVPPRVVAPQAYDRHLQEPLVRAGQAVGDTDLAAAREHHVRSRRGVPWQGLSLSRGEPAIATHLVAGPPHPPPGAGPAAVGVGPALPAARTHRGERGDN